MARPARIEGKVLSHSLESGVLAGLAVWLAAAYLPAQVQVWMPAGLAMVAATMAMFSTWAHTGHTGIGVYVGAFGYLLTCWVVVARLVSPWSGPVIFALVALVTAMAPAGALVASCWHADQEEAAAAARRKAILKEIRYWEKLFRDMDLPGIKVLDVLDIETGKKVIGEFSKITADQRAVTFASLEATAIPIAMHERMPEDAVFFEKGDTAAHFSMTMRTKAKLDGPVFLPRANTARQVTDPVSLGVTDEGKDWQELLREIHMLIIAATGSGKSNLINVLIAQLARCTDCVIFMVDTKGGRTARPWVAPWAKEMCSRPVIDWVATTRAEAYIMLRALNRAVQARSRSGYGGEKITPDEDMPALVFICDEGAFVFGHNKKEDGVSSAKLAQEAQDFVEMSRSEAGMAILAGVRGNVDTWGNTGIKAMCKLRVALAVTSAADAGSVFQDDHRAAQALSRITEPGDGMLLNTRRGKRMSPRVRFYRVTDGSRDEETKKVSEDMITPIALETGDRIRPALDKLTADAMGEDYENRWYRDHGRDLIDAYRGAMPPLHPVGGEFGAVLADAFSGDDSEIDPRHLRVWELLQSTQYLYAGATPKQLFDRLAAEGKGVHRATLHRWLSEDQAAGKLSNARFGRWKWALPADEDEAACG